MKFVGKINAAVLFNWIYSLMCCFVSFLDMLGLLLLNEQFILSTPMNVTCVQFVYERAEQVGRRYQHDVPVCSARVLSYTTVYAVAAAAAVRTMTYIVSLLVYADVGVCGDNNKMKRDSIEQAGCSDAWSNV